jgi:hypothetical protein
LKTGAFAFEETRMGYHLTIVRSARGRKLPISFDEARAAALALGGWQCDDDPQQLTFTTEAGAVTLWHERGTLWTSSPEEGAWPPMLDLAQRLGARLRGDEFETYRSRDETYTHPDDVLLRRQADAAGEDVLAQSRRQNDRMRYAVMGFFVLLALVGGLIGYGLQGR